MREIAHPACAYMAVIKNVREVMLTCGVNLAFWQQRLKSADLFPCNIGGKAEIALIAIESKFMGITFRELSISIALAQPQDAAHPTGSLLLHAFNSVRLFAFAERTFFQTPYYPANIQVNEQLPASISLHEGKQVRLNAAMTGQPPVSRQGEEVWEKPIFLPVHPGRHSQVFYARLSGYQSVYPFASDDVLELNAHDGDPVFRLLLESELTGQAWHIRQNAVHARSKTYEREL